MLILHLKATRDRIFKGYAVIVSNEGHAVELAQGNQYTHCAWITVKAVQGIAKGHMINNTNISATIKDLW